MATGLHGESAPIPGSTTTKKKSKSYVVTDLTIGLQAGTDRTLFATWKWKHFPATTDHYGVTWRYYTNQGVWFVGNSEDLKHTSSTDYVRATYSAPANAIRVSVRVQPYSTTYQLGNANISYWRAQTKEAIFDFNTVITPAKPSTPIVTIDGNFNLVAELSNISDQYSHQIEFEIVKDDSRTIKTGMVKVVTQHAAFQHKVSAGGKYKVRCRAVRFLNPTGATYTSGVSLKSSKTLVSDWSDYSSNVSTVPTAPTRITGHNVQTPTSLYLYWNAVANATEYTVEYATSKGFFDTSTVTKNQTVSTNTAYLEGLDTGTTWYFRVKAKNTQGDSGWSAIYSLVIGVAPAAPTTWSETSTGVVGENVKLYWVHNAEDASIQNAAQIQVKINNEDWTDYTPTYLSTTPGEASYLDFKTFITVTDNITDSSNANVIDDDNANVIGTAHIDYSEGMVLRWRVRTKGVMTTGGPNNDGYSPWSTERVVVLYTPPSINLNVTNAENGTNVIYTYASFPIYIYATAYPTTQTPVGWNISIIANESYEAYNDIGDIIVVSAGDEVFSEYIPGGSNSMSRMLTAKDVDFENNQGYVVKVTVSMNSGLTAEAQQGIAMIWDSDNLWPNAEISIDRDKLCAYIRPYCLDEEDNLIENVTLTVCRREYDGRFKVIQDDIENTREITITDPHPALNLARYRIIAVSSDTGQIGYYDLPGEPVGETGIIIQWDEKWTDYNIASGDNDGIADPLWAGSMLKLPYNIKVSESTSIDKSLVEYIGRSAPVSYYGTQLGVSGSWSAEIPATDMETVYALRRLQIYRGDCYVREPNGVGYWANIEISFNKDYNNMLIPISINVTRVEGGI